MGASCLRSRLLFWILPLALLCLPLDLTQAQVIPLPTGQSNTLIRPSLGGELDLAPSNPLGLPGSSFLGPSGSDIVPLSSGMFSDVLPRFSNLDFGFLYEFSNSGLNNTFLFADYLIPYSPHERGTIFGQVDFIYQCFRPNNGRSQQFPPVVIADAFNNVSVATDDLVQRVSTGRVNLSIGGGYRSFIGPRTLVGVNAFYDNYRLFGDWYGSWGWGLETIYGASGNDRIDLRLNQYGNYGLAQTWEVWRTGNFSGDIEAGYSHGLLNGAYDLRLKVNGYQFASGTGDKIYGYRVGADLRTGNGLLRTAVDYGRDRDNGSYGTVMAYVNVGIQLENLRNFESPFTMPEPIFSSPERNLREWLTSKVIRNTNLPAQVVSTGSIGNGFVIEIDGPYTAIPGGIYVQQSPTEGLWVLQGAASAAGPRAAQYRIRLAGNTNGVSFPLTVTITGVANPPIASIAVNGAGVGTPTTTVVFTNPGQVITVAGGGGVNKPRVNINAGPYNALPSGYFLGTITITAPGMPTLTIRVVKG